MIDIIDELTSASNNLRTALHRYKSACLALQGCHTDESVITRSVSRELSERLDRELLEANSYDITIQQAKSSINTSRNYCFHIAPVNTLPSELLGRIFQLVVDTQPCDLRDTNDPAEPASANLARLLHVCTHWRRVATTLPGLWSHIDIASGFLTKSLARAEAYAFRAGQCLLDVHIVDTNQDYKAQSQRYYPDLSRFLTSIASRVRSLRIRTGAENHVVTVFYRCVFQSLFLSQPSGSFVQLIIENQDQSIKFIKPADDAGGFLAMSLDLSSSCLSDAWLSVKDLRLTGLYPWWTSTAYHGLVELHLVAGKWDLTTIEQRQLANILRASPALHTFHLGLRIFESLSSYGEDDLVWLNELRTLVWTRTSPAPGELSRLLGWLVPGPKPLYLSIEASGNQDCAHDWEIMPGVKEFLIRSNIGELRWKEAGISSAHVTELLDLVPSLEPETLDIDNGKHPTAKI